MTGTRVVVVVGALETTRRACAELRDTGHDVVHLSEPTEADLRAVLGSQTGASTGAGAAAVPEDGSENGRPLGSEIEAVVVIVRSDLVALRYALLVEHLRPAVRLLVTVFDRTVADQLVRAIPNCQVTSPADVAVPSILAACLDQDTLAIDVRGPEPRALVRFGSTVEMRPWRDRMSARTRVMSILAAQARSHDGASRILMLGLGGLLAALAAEWLLAAAVLHENGPQALYAATRLISTVGPAETDRAPDWYLVVSGLGMMLTLGFAALFTAGVVERSLSARTAGIIGTRTPPRRDHVVVVGLGQVGLRLCLALRSLGVPVVAVERDPQAANLRLAKAARIPVLIAHAEDRSVLERLRLPNARALAAMGADELDNVEVAIAALATVPDLRIVLRAGDNDVITETRSLFPIGAVCDISALTAFAVAAGVGEQVPDLVYQRGQEAAAYPAAGSSAPTTDGEICEIRSR